MKPNDKAIDAARAEGKRWQEGLNRPENQIPCWKVLREADDGYDGYDVIAKFNSREERDEALERFRAEAMVTAAYAAQFQSGDYAGLVERLRAAHISNRVEWEAADAIEMLLAKMNSKPKPSGDYEGLVERLRKELFGASGDDIIAAADALEAVLAERDALRKWKEDDSDAMRIFTRYRELEAERNAAIAEIDTISSAIKSHRYMDPPDGGSVTIAEQVARMWEENEALLARLAPVDDEALVEIGMQAGYKAEYGVDMPIERAKTSFVEYIYKPMMTAAIAAIRPHIEAAEREKLQKMLARMGAGTTKTGVVNE